VRKGQIDADARIHPSANVWDLAHVRTLAQIGAESIIGRGVYIGPKVTVGARCKIQNYAQVFEPAIVDDGVFIGPGAILTNDRYPRAITLDSQLKSARDWNPVGVQVEYGASIGAGAICVAPLRIGRWAVIAAGSVVTKNVRAYELVAGSPATHLGWVGPAGVKLMVTREGKFQCPLTKQCFIVNRSGDLETVE